VLIFNAFPGAAATVLFSDAITYRFRQIGNIGGRVAEDPRAGKVVSHRKPYC
jgi:hypothetical protein